MLLEFFTDSYHKEGSATPFAIQVVDLKENQFDNLMEPTISLADQDEYLHFSVITDKALSALSFKLDLSENQDETQIKETSKQESKFLTSLAHPLMAMAYRFSNTITIAPMNNRKQKV